MGEYSKNVIDFDSLKNAILSIISKGGQIFDYKLLPKDSGIYLLYVDNFEDERVIPFYIGKAVNISKRFQDHIKDLKKIMQYSRGEYHNEFFLGAIGLKTAFEGKYRPCKIFKYLLDHNCNIEDVKMIVLEKCQKEFLYEREQHYLSLYLPAYFGFNQIPTITEQFVYRDNPEKRRLIVENDYRCFRLYMKYGYSTFNYLHSFSGLGSRELDEIVNELICNHLWPGSKELFSQSLSALKKYQDAYQDAYAQISDKFAKEIHNIFDNCRLKSKSREEEVLDAFTNHFPSTIIDDVTDNLNYLKYYFSRDKKSQECGRLITDLYQKHLWEIDEIISPVKKSFTFYVESRKTALEQSRFSIIFPKQYLK